MERKFNAADIQNIVSSYAKPPNKYFEYGTAGGCENRYYWRILRNILGFREEWKLLHSTVQRVGILACLRSRSVAAKCIGVMITASHNGQNDNGVKIVDYDGGMLSQSWEPYAQTLANDLAEDFFHSISFISLAEGCDENAKAIVILGRDTRSHSKELSDCCKAGILAIGGICHDIGEVTTPQLHFVVRSFNMGSGQLDPYQILLSYPTTLAGAYAELMSTVPSGPYLPSAPVVDVAGGVGDLAIRAIASWVDNNREGILSIDLRNGLGSVPVNERCGAEYVQKQRVPPRGVDPHSDAGKLLCSFDGDADRIVFHAFLEGGSSSWVLFDGDKIAVLFAAFFLRELRQAKLADRLKVGVVQTAYANGASSRYLRENGVEVVVAKTGVKHLHPRAKEFDIGIYFEANGHGTVLFSDDFYSVIDGSSTPQSAESLSKKRLKVCFLRLAHSI